MWKEINLISFIHRFLEKICQKMVTSAKSRVSMIDIDVSQELHCLKGTLSKTLSKEEKTEGCICLYLFCIWIIYFSLYFVFVLFVCLAALPLSFELCNTLF